MTDLVLTDGSIASIPGISERKSGTSTFDHGNYLGTYTRQTNASQTTTATRVYDAFGNLESTTGSPQSGFGFVGGQGYQEDSNSGLKLLGHRYYDSSTGRFLTRDQAKDGRNWYGYCNGSPTSNVDPLGLWGISINLGARIIIPGYSVSIQLSWTIGPDGGGVGATLGHGPGFGLYAGAGGSLSYSNGWSANDPQYAHQNGYANGIATPVISLEEDDNGNPFNGGNDGGGIGIGPSIGVGGIYHEKREGGFLPFPR